MSISSHDKTIVKPLGNNGQTIGKPKIVPQTELKQCSVLRNSIYRDSFSGYLTKISKPKPNLNVCN